MKYSSCFDFFFRHLKMWRSFLACRPYRNRQWDRFGCGLLAPALTIALFRAAWTVKSNGYSSPFFLFPWFWRQHSIPVFLYYPLVSSESFFPPTYLSNVGISKDQLTYFLVYSGRVIDSTSWLISDVNVLTQSMDFYMPGFKSWLQ